MFQTKIISANNEAPATAPIELSVIVPVFNEAANVPRMVARLRDVLAGIAWEVIFVDDHSPDGTARIARSIAATDHRVRIIERIGRRGLSTAVIEGFLASAAPVFAVIDGDMQHDEGLLPAMLATINDGHDLVVGSRYVSGGGVGEWDDTRVNASRFATRAANLVLKTPISDPMSGFFAIRREAFEAALPRLSGSGFKILLDLAVSSPRALSIVELPYTFRTRELGESKLDIMVMVEFAELLADKSIGRYVPVKLLMFLAVGALGLGVHLGVLGSVYAAGARFAVAQAIAVGVAMVFNFALNNVFTYRDRRLKGWRFVTGLLSFAAVCSVGAVASVGIGNYVHDMDNAWWVSGIAGAIVGAVWNYAATSFVTWRK